MTDRTGDPEHGQDGDRGVGPAEAGQPVGTEPQELATVAAAMATVRAAMPAAGGPASVPDDEEVAALEHAHDTLRTSLDRAERGG